MVMIRMLSSVCGLSVICMADVLLVRTGNASTVAIKSSRGRAVMLQHVCLEGLEPSWLCAFLLTALSP